MSSTRVAAMVVAVLAIALLGGCAGIPNDGRYQTHGTGWDNFRAEASVKASTTKSS